MTTISTLSPVRLDPSSRQKVLTSLPVWLLLCHFNCKMARNTLFYNLNGVQANGSSSLLHLFSHFLLQSPIYCSYTGCPSILWLFLVLHAIHDARHSSSQYMTMAFFVLFLPSPFIWCFNSPRWYQDFSGKWSGTTGLRCGCLCTG